MLFIMVCGNTFGSLVVVHVLHVEVRASGQRWSFTNQNSVTMILTNWTVCRFPSATMAFCSVTPRTWPSMIPSVETVSQQTTALDWWVPLLRRGWSPVCEQTCHYSWEKAFMSFFLFFRLFFGYFQVICANKIAVLDSVWDWEHLAFPDPPSFLAGWQLWDRWSMLWDWWGESTWWVSTVSTPGGQIPVVHHLWWELFASICAPTGLVDWLVTTSDITKGRGSFALEAQAFAEEQNVLTFSVAHKRQLRHPNIELRRFAIKFHQMFLFGKFGTSFRELFLHGRKVDKHHSKIWWTLSPCSFQRESSQFSPHKRGQCQSFLFAWISFLGQA